MIMAHVFDKTLQVITEETKQKMRDSHIKRKLK